MSPFEAIARAQKVARIVAIVPRSASKAEAAAVADKLAAFMPAQRARWAAAAGVTRAPSDLTWAWAVAAVRESAPPRNVVPR